MKIKDLKVGDVVYIREDINHPEKIWANRYDEPRLTGVQQIFKVIRENKCFEIVGDLDRSWVNRNTYTVEMIDWENTKRLNNIKNSNRMENINTTDLAKEYLNSKFGYLNTNKDVANETIKLEVGSFVVLRDDLVSGREYDNCLYVSSMAYSFNKDKLIDEKIPCLRIKEYINSVLKSGNPETINHFVVYDQPPFMTYSYEMLHWEKSIILNYLISKLNFCIEEAMYILDRVYENYMSTVNSNILSNKQYASNEEKYIDTTSNEEKYIDLELKGTSVLRFQDMLLSEDTLTSKVTDDMLNTLTIKTIRSNEEHDIEKAVMMTILKSIGIKYSDILKCVDLVQEKWVPEYGERYYSIRNLQKIEYLTNWELNSDRYNFLNNNYFKTREEAETKVQEIKKLLNEGRD